MKVLKIFPQLKMQLFACIFIVSLFAGLSCTKFHDTVFQPNVAINHDIVRVADTAGSTRIIVYSRGDWSANLLEKDIDWVKIKEGRGSGTGQFFIDFESNEGNLPRQTILTVEGTDKKDTIIFQQRGIPTTIDIKDTVLLGIASGGKMKSGIISNIPFELMTMDITYRGDLSPDWISEVDIEEMKSLVFRLSRTDETEERVAQIKLSYLDALGTLNQDSIVIRQRPKAGNDSDFAEQRDMNYIKTMLPEGIISENIFLEGIVISEKGNDNLATNLNTSAANVSPRENQVTFYVQDPDNQSGGILFKAKESSDNIFDQYQRVKIWLKGTKLTKYSNPTRYTIEDVTNDHVLEINEGEAVQPKEVYMKDLTDLDIYTWVKLKDVEIAVSNGAFSNMHEGYAARVSIYASCIRDINRNSMYMLINTGVPYRQEYTPRGGGTITGILVHDYILRFGGDIGRYSIRPLRRSDIKIAEERDNGFTRTFIEWTGYKAGAPNPLAPDIGLEYRAKLSHSLKAIGSGPDFNGPGLTSTGGYNVSGWWNSGKGDSWIFEFSTIGINNPMSMQLEGNSIVGGPRNWVLEWSESMDAATWEVIGEYTLQDYVRAGNETLYTQVAGYKVVDFPLPNAMLNKNMVYVRARVKNNEAGTNTSDTGGTITTASSRLGHVSIKENK